MIYDEVIHVTEDVVYLPILNAFVEYKLGVNQYPGIASIEIDDDWLGGLNGKGWNEKRYIEYQKIMFELSPVIIGFLALTNKCNQNCEFCYAHANTDLEDRKFDISWVEKLAGFNDKNLLQEVSFTGGEPLLEWNVIRDCVDIIKAPYKIYTNGLLLSEDKIKFLLKTNGKIYVAIDVKSEDDWKGHKDVFDVVKKFVMKYPEFKNRVELSACTSCSNINNISGYREKMYSLFGKEMLIDYQYICSGMDKDGLKEAILKDKNDVLIKGVDPRVTIFGRYLRWLGVWMKEGINATSCSPNVSLNYRGDFSLCHEYGASFDMNPDYKKMIVGNINEINSFEELRSGMIRKTYELKLGYRMDACSKCALRYFCGGICWANVNYNLYLCYIAKQVIPHLIEILVQNKVVRSDGYSYSKFGQEWFEQGIQNRKIRSIDTEEKLCCFG